MTNKNYTLEKLGVSPDSVYGKYLLGSGGFSHEPTGVLIYSLNEVEERNETFEVKKYLPQYVMIGDDGGGTGLLIKTKDQSVLYESGLGDLSEGAIRTLAGDFMSWINELNEE
jgi:hypothetical protein